MLTEMITLIGSLIEPVSWALIHSLWQGGLIALLLAITLAVVRSRTSQFRYALSCAALGAMFVLFVSTVVVLSGDAGLRTDSAATENPATVATDTADQNAPKAIPAVEGEVTITPEMVAYGESASLTPWVFRAWLVGVLLLSLYHLLGWRKALQLVRTKTQAVPTEWQERFDRLQAELALSRPVRLVKSALVKSPCVVGWVKPVVLVPVSVFAGLTPEQLEMVLVHELAHVRRFDILVNYLQTAVETIMFFHPATWWISRQVRIEREHCCDDLAVQTCGDRLQYARALADLDDLRNVTPALSLAVDETPLVSRIRRLAGRPSLSQGRNGIGPAGAIIVGLLMTVAVWSAVSVSPESVMADPDDSLTAEYEQRDGDYHGRWDAESDDDYIVMQVRFRSEKSSRTFRFYPEDLEEVFIQTDGGFSLEYDAGTFWFEGKLDEDDRWGYEGAGRCHFRPSESYAEELERFGFRSPSRKKAFSLGIHGVQLDFIRGLVEAGFDRMSLDDLIKMHIHDVNPEYIAELEALGYDDLDEEMLVKMRIHDVDPDEIRMFREMGYRRLSAEDLVKMQIHDVDADFIEGMAELGFGRLDSETLVKMQIHDVSPYFIRQMADLGYDNLDTEELVKMRIHDVDPHYITELDRLGYRNIDAEQLVKMRIHDVEPYFILELAELGLEDVDAEDLVRMRIHDVTPRFIKGLRERGYDRLTPDRLVRYKIHGIPRASRR